MSAPFDLAEYLAAHGAGVDAALRRAVTCASEGLDPGLAAALEHGVLSDGKRLRPVLCVTAHLACGGRPSRDLYDLGAALELIHAYSLMHDDLPCMDDAELRRGRPTTHRVHGEAATVRAGAALIPAAASQAWRAARGLGCDLPTARAVVRALLAAAGAGGMVGGQWMDLEGEGRTLEPEELHDLHRRKTGALLTASLEIGALAAGASEGVREALIRYGRAVGLAFQIADDVLDATQSAERLGKNPSDAELDKSTFVTRYGLDEAARLGRAQVERALDALRQGGLGDPALPEIARYVVERTR